MPPSRRHSQNRSLPKDGGSSVVTACAIPRPGGWPLHLLYEPSMRIQPHRTLECVIEGAVRMYSWSEAKALTMNVRDRIPESLRKDALARRVELGQAKLLEPRSTQRITKQGEVAQVSVISTALLDATGKLYAVSPTERVEERGEK